MNSQTGGAARRPGADRGGPARAAAPPPARAPLAEQHVVLAKLVDDRSQQPLRARYEVVDSRGQAVARGETDHTGIVRHTFPQAGSYTVKVLELQDG